MNSRSIGKRAVAKRKIGAPARVYENLGGEVFSGPGVGSLWKMPIRFLEKSGTSIYVSLTGEDGRKLVFQRSNRADWIKRLLATVAWKEARIDLGYQDAVVWIGSRRFQPTSDDLIGLGCKDDELDAVRASVRVSAPRNGKGHKHKGDDPMSKKTKKGKKAKKVKKAKKSSKASKSSGARTPDERAKSNPSAYCAFLIGTTKKTNDQIGRKVRAKFPDCSDAYDEGSGVSYTRKAIAEGVDRFDWVQEVSGFKMKNVTSHLDDERPRRSSKKDKVVKKGKTVVRKGKVKKVHKRPITKKSGRKVVKKVRR